MSLGQSIGLVVFIVSLHILWQIRLLVKDVLNNWQRNESSNSQLAPVRQDDSAN